MRPAKSNSPATSSGPDMDAAREEPAGVVASWNRFWFRPQDPIGLHGLRICAGAFFLTWLLSFAGHQTALFGMEGWFDAQAYRDASRLPDGAPSPIGWSPIFLAQTSSQLNLLYGASIAAVALFTLGVWTRITGVLTWLVVVTFTQNPAITFGGDAILLVLSFYLMIGYLLFGLRQRPLSFGSLLLGPKEALVFRSWRADSRRTPSIAANIVVRLVQIHIAIVIFTMGMHKLQISVWWAGAALWFPLHPAFSTTLEAATSPGVSPTFYMAWLSLAAYVVMAWEVSFPFVAWRKAWRPVVLLGALCFWLGNRFVYEMPIFGPAVFIGCLSFLSTEGWRRVAGAVESAVGLARHGSKSLELAPKPIESHSNSVA